jgi:hypothetical protein
MNDQSGTWPTPFFKVSKQGCCATFTCQEVDHEAGEGK